MGYYLNRFAKIVAVSLTVDDRLVDASCRNTVVTCGLDAGKPLIVSQIEVGLHTIGCYVTLTMFVGVERSWIDVDIGVELLDGYLVAACLQQLADTSRDDAFSQ